MARAAAVVAAAASWAGQGRCKGNKGPDMAGDDDNDDDDNAAAAVAAAAAAAAAADDDDDDDDELVSFLSHHAVAATDDRRHSAFTHTDCFKVAVASCHQLVD